MQAKWGGFVNKYGRMLINPNKNGLKCPPIHGFGPIYCRKMGSPASKACTIRPINLGVGR